MRSPVPRGKYTITRQNELEARIQALETMVGALLRFSAGQQDLAEALKEARQRGEAFVRDPGNEVPPEYAECFRGAFHTLAVSMIPLGELESFQAALHGRQAVIDPKAEPDPPDAMPS